MSHTYIPTSLILKTDLIFIKQHGEVIDKGEYVVVKTESSPNFFWGNYLLFKNPPTLGDYQKWTSLFRSEFTNPNIYHMTFRWDLRDRGNSSEFIQNGFIEETDIALTIVEKNLIKPKKFSSEIEIKPLTTDNDWLQSIECHINAGMEDLSLEKRQSFYTTQMANYKKLVIQNLGLWFGAFLENKIVSTCGIFFEDTIGRYQLVSTDINHRRYGYCSTLIYETAHYAFSKMKLNKLVIVADANYHAAKLYESVGFKPAEKMYGLSIQSS